MSGVLCVMYVLHSLFFCVVLFLAATLTWMLFSNKLRVEVWRIVSKIPRMFSGEVQRERNCSWSSEDGGRNLPVLWRSGCLPRQERWSIKCFISFSWFLELIDHPSAQIFITTVCFWKRAQILVAETWYVSLVLFVCDSKLLSDDLDLPYLTWW